MTTHEKYIARCLELAQQGAGRVAPNPMVGAVLVHKHRIIGEGWHRQFGGPHAEVNCINRAIENGHQSLLTDSTLYVSLEPCAHYGKTPPCSDLIIRTGIPRVVIGVRDPFEEVNGKGIEKLQTAGVDVVTGVLEKECREMNKRFFVFHTERRPFVILKWAETGDGFIGTPPGDVKRLFISNEFTNRLVHQWRSEEAAILVGTNTALADDPQLTTRLWPGHSPVRLVVDRGLRLPGSLNLFDTRVPTIVFNSVKHEMDQYTKTREKKSGPFYYQLNNEPGTVQQIMNALYRLNLQSVMIEGGSRLLHAFIDGGTWDEARVIINDKLKINSGVKAPVITDAHTISEKKILSDRIMILRPGNSRLPTPDSQHSTPNS